MKNIHGICGTHGTGKSTIMNGIVETYSVNRTQVSRTVQSRLGWVSLSDGLKNVGNMWKLQNTIFDVMVERDKSVSTPTFVERTPADVWAYTKTWCYRFGIDAHVNDEALAYRQKLGKHAAAYYENLFFIPIHEKVPFVFDPNRADADSRESVQQEIISFCASFNLPIRYIFSTSVDDRVDEILSKV